MTDWKEKIVFVALGLATIGAAFGTKYPIVSGLTTGWILIVAGALALGSVVWKTAYDLKFDNSDISSWLTTILGLVLLLAGIFTPLKIQGYDWFSTLTLLGASVVGVLIIFIGLFKK